MRRAARVDANQPSIVAALLRAGCSVQSLAALGKGCPDLLVGFAGDNYLMEVKNPEKPKADQRLTVDQVRWHDEWHGSVSVVWTAEEALAVIGLFGGRIESQ